ncbi:MAG: hypothetical protein ACREBW_05800, partial [Candidatus Micrarchaeaceae archaeon]
MKTRNSIYSTRSIILKGLLFCVLFLNPIFAKAQLSIQNWEDVGRIWYTAAAVQGSKVVLTTEHGYLYSTTDMGLTWVRDKLDDTLSLN